MPTIEYNRFRDTWDVCVNHNCYFSSSDYDIAYDVYLELLDERWDD